MCIFIGVNRICSLLSRERKNEKYVFVKENEEMTWETGQTTAKDGERNYLPLKIAWRFVAWRRRRRHQQSQELIARRCIHLYF